MKKNGRKINTLGIEKVVKIIECKIIKCKIFLFEAQDAHLTPINQRNGTNLAWANMKILRKNLSTLVIKKFCVKQPNAVI